MRIAGTHIPPRKLKIVFDEAVPYFLDRIFPKGHPPLRDYPHVAVIRSHGLGVVCMVLSHPHYLITPQKTHKEFMMLMAGDMWEGIRGMSKYIDEKMKEIYFSDLPHTQKKNAENYLHSMYLTLIMFNRHYEKLNKFIQQHLN